MNAYQQVISNLESLITNAEAEHKELVARASEKTNNLIALRRLKESLTDFKGLLDLEPGTPEEAKPLRLEVGKRYVRRDGCNTDPLTRSVSSFMDPSEPAYSYTEDGRLCGASIAASEWSWYDLIAEYVEPDSSEGWEFFQGQPSHSGSRSFWAFKGDEGFFHPWHTLGWRTCGETKETVSSHSSVSPLPNLPPGIPMP